MTRIVFPGILVFLALVPLSQSAPVDGPSWSYKQVSAGSGPGDTITEPGILEFEKTFKANQRACVIVVGDHKPVVDVEIKVFDAKNNLVAEDRGQAPAADFAAVMWYPPREETYRIAIHSYGKEFNKCSVAVK